MTKLISTRRLRTAACAVLLATLAPFSLAWTNKPVRIIVPAPPGGLIDIMARLLSEQLTVDLGTPVIVDNRPGASGGIAVQALLAAPPDGQTLMVTASNVLSEVPHVLKQQTFDPLKDVKPLAAVALTRLILVGSSELPPKDFNALLAYGKANPGKLSFATYGVGTASHYSGVILNQKAGLDLQHVPFSGAPPAVQQVMGRQVSVMFDNIAHSLPMVRAGRLQIYAVAAKSRTPLLPDVPSTGELGYPDIAFTNFMGVIASARMAPELMEAIRVAVYKAAGTAKSQQRMTEMGFEPIAPQSRDQLSAALRAESDRNAAIVKAFGIHSLD